MAVRIYLGGEPCLANGGQLIGSSRLPGRQGRMAFAYLVCERSRAVTRDELAQVLWPDRLPAEPDVALSAIISKLRALLDEINVGRRALIAASGCYQLELPAGSWVDIEEAVESVHLAEAALRDGRWRAAYGPAVVACAILRRAFLAGADGEWVDSRRELLRRARLRALDCLAQIHELNGEPALALRAAEEAIELEPFRETGYRRLMLLHDGQGNPAQALRVYEKLSSMLAAELNTKPGSETLTVLHGIRNPDR